MSLPKLSRLDLQIMQALWVRGPLSIREIQESFPEPDRPPYTSIQTIVYRLEEKGTVRRVRKIGNAHIFEAVISRQEVSGRFIDDFGQRFAASMAGLGVDPDQDRVITGLSRL